MTYLNRAARLDKQRDGLLQLMWRIAGTLDDVRQTEAYADVLQLSSETNDATRRLVKQHKDRLIKKLSRLGVRIRGRSSDSKKSI